MLFYETLLDLKHNVLKPRQNYSDLSESAIPAVRPTIPSPLQYGYPQNYATYTTSADEGEQDARPFHQ
ncbi:hypothetical protein EDB84DRAFT_1506980 [Lactarius hengduanensis]|nr:hypothetical protein EDB84DRAFT_1506980 [Lactarius hengduanensis]